jgi:ABC-type uncharacterized transport system substrate-binding protein
VPPGDRAGRADGPEQAEAQATLTQIRKGEVDGILVPPAGSQQGIPTMFSYATFFVDQDEGLASYGADFSGLGRLAARLVDKILKGTKPAEIPVEVISRTEFVINLKVAKTLGLTIALDLLYRADRLVR